MAFPKQEPEKVAISAGISLPTGLKAQAAHLAASEGDSLSAMVRKMLREKLKKAGYSVEQSGDQMKKLSRQAKGSAKSNHSKAKAYIKKRR